MTLWQDSLITQISAAIINFVLYSLPRWLNDWYIVRSVLDAGAENGGMSKSNNWMRPCFCLFVCVILMLKTNGKIDPRLALVQTISKLSISFITESNPFFKILSSVSVESVDVFQFQSMVVTLLGRSTPFMKSYEKVSSNPTYAYSNRTGEFDFAIAAFKSCIVDSRSFRRWLYVLLRSLQVWMNQHLHEVLQCHFTLPLTHWERSYIVSYENKLVHDHIVILASNYLSARGQ